jgi:RHS repeat-associated protein
MTICARSVPWRLRRILFHALLALPLAALAQVPNAFAGGADEPWTGTYVYDGAGNIKAIGSNHYYYDGVGRLVEATANTIAPNDVQNYFYDAFGNLREVQTNHGALPTTIIGVSTTTNRITDKSRCTPGTTCIVAEFDDPGHQISGTDGSQYGYDAADMMTTLDNASRHEVYVYDANDQRIATVSNVTTAPSWHYTLRDGTANVLREWTASNGLWSCTKDYVYRGGVLLASITDPGVAEQRTHVHVDHLNTPRLLTDDDGRKVSVHTYWPFGIEAKGSDRDAETHKFTGHERDFAASGSANDLDYMHARYYGPTMGRFLSIDPNLDTKRAAATPQSWNRYSYAKNAPINLVDPDGKQAVMPTVLPGPPIDIGLGHVIQMQTNPEYRRMMVDTTRTVGRNFINEFIVVGSITAAIAQSTYKPRDQRAVLIGQTMQRVWLASAQTNSIPLNVEPNRHGGEWAAASVAALQLAIDKGKTIYDIGYDRSKPDDSSNHIAEVLSLQAQGFKPHRAGLFIDNDWVVREYDEWTRTPMQVQGKSH